MIPTLREFYGLQPTPPADLFQFFVWELLSEHAVSARRDLAWQALRRIPALTPDAILRTPAKELLDAIGIAGPHREEKLERIRAIAGEFKRHRDLLSAERLAHLGTIAAGRALCRITLVTPDVRARALLFVAGRRVLPVDEEINRVASRLMGEPENRRRARSRRWLLEQLAANVESCRDAVIYLRHHALHTCLKVGPHCGVCPLASRCGSVQRRDPPA